MNNKVLFNDGWTFAKSGLEAPDSSGLGFEPIDIPHDWLIWQTHHLYENSIGWYRKLFSFRAGEEKRRYLLYFEGVYMDSSLYVNGRLVGEWKYGYSSFEHDITDALIDGENELLVKVVHQSPNSRWYSGAGIYRNVWLKTRGASYMETDGVYIAAKSCGDGGWSVEVETELALAEEAMLTHTLMQDDQIVAEVACLVGAEAGEETAVSTIVMHQELIVKEPQLWSTEAPNLYRLVTELRRLGGGDVEVVAAGAVADGGTIERLEHPVGFRTVELHPEKGFSLNGRRMKLNGVCEHHDLGALGAAFNREAQRKRFVLLKAMGVNAIRTAHNMPAPEVMELADEMGLLVVSEAFDMWERAKTPYDYARFFLEWAERDVRSWVRRDRNHPSLIMWSIGNEIYDTHADTRGQELTVMLMEEVLKHDPKGNGRVTIGSNFMPWENAQTCADIVKVAGYNYAEKYYEQHHAEHPDWIIYGSETSSVVQSRGVYRFPLEQSILADDDEQCSALGNSTTSWGAKSAEACILAERDTPFSLGQFLWTGFDYIGEPTPYHTKNSYFGQLDTAGFPKDPYYIYQAAWTDYRVSPMVHLFPDWDFNPGQLIDVRVATNAPKVELRLNGRVVGSREIDHEHGRELVPSWKLPFEPGELQAIAYDVEGRVIATAVRHSFGDARSIRLHADKERMKADGLDLIFVEIGMDDEDGHPVDNANNRVTVEVSGAGRLIGLDNGDSTDYDAYKGMSRRLFSGKLLAIVCSTLESGTVQVTVSSKGMESRVIVLKAVGAEPDGGRGHGNGKDDGNGNGLAALGRNREFACVAGSLDELPLRKLEIVSEGGQLLNAERREIAVRAVPHPADTTYRDVEWSVVNDAGIVSNIAKVEANGLEARIAALGDGEFRLRCTSRNGTDKTKLISQLEFKAVGLGKAYKNPYEFISAGLYDFSRGEVGNGNERGIATSRDGETVAGFSDIDFGPVGSDTITLPIFALSSEPYELQIWEGIPGEAGSELMADVIYEKESRWNVYQEETYRLSKRLTGTTSIAFLLRKKVHIKGFIFERQSKAFELRYAADCDHLYGDSYTITDRNVEGIGNNVSLAFTDMDFGEDGATRLTICGRTPLDNNTIQVRFSGSAGESGSLLEFASGGPGSVRWSGARSESDAGLDAGLHPDTVFGEYITREFELDKITGLKTVTFLFLPGSNFDFAWFRFDR